MSDDYDENELAENFVKIVIN